MPLLFIAALVAASGATAAPPPAPDAAIEARVTSHATAIQAALAKDRASVEAAVTRAIDAILDVPRFGRACLPQTWSTLTPGDQARFVAAFRTLLIRQFVSPLIGDGDVKITPLGRRRVGAEVLVRVRIEGRKNARELEWVFPDDARGRATDSIVDEARQSATYSRSLERTVRRRGFDGLIEKLSR